tara:strand:- start:425 stop:1069 length:645 start_codon:yes stop_codon:yes gene_type:complete
MDEDTAIINSNTRNEKIKNFFVNNKKILIYIFITVLICLFGYFAFVEYNEKKKIRISDQYNLIVTKYSEQNKETAKNDLIDLIKTNDSTYSPLSLYFIIDKNLITDATEINNLFDQLIKETRLPKEIKNLVIYKKALFNADNVEENDLLEILKPIINSNSVWKSHALYLMAEYFFSKNEKKKSKEFFNQIILLDNANQELKIESQKRLNRDLSD